MEKLFLQALEIKEPQERAQVIAELVRRWVSIDLKGLIAFVNTMEVRAAAYGDIWKVLAPALITALPQLDDATASLPALKALVRRLVSYLAATDPDRALAWAQQWLSGELLDSARAKVATQIAATRSQEAFQILETIQQPARRLDALNGIGSAVGRVDSARAIEWARGLSHFGERPYAMASVLQAMAETSPEEAAREFERYRTALTGEYAAELARDRPLLPKDAANLVEGDLGNREVLPSPVNPQLNLLNDAGLAIAERWAAIDPAAAVRWAEGIPDGHLKQEVIYSALASWAATDGRAAAAYFDASPMPDAGIAEALHLAWSRTDAEAAARHAGTIANAAARSAAIGGVVEGWIEAGGDRNAIGLWVDGLRDASARDLAQSQLAELLSLENPAAAWRRAARIGDSGQRSEALATAFAALLEANPSSAKRTLLAARLPAGDAATLRRMLDTVAGN